jgi:hypothetical protein
MVLGEVSHSCHKGSKVTPDVNVSFSGKLLGSCPDVGVMPGADVLVAGASAELGSSVARRLGSWSSVRSGRDGDSDH